LLIGDWLFRVHVGVVDGADRACSADAEPRTGLSLAVADDGQDSDMVRRRRIQTVQRHRAAVAVHLPRP